MDLTARSSAWLLLLELLTACAGAGKGRVLPSPPSVTPENSAAAAPTHTAIPSCPVTLPNGKSPSAADALRLNRSAADGAGFNLGNEDGTLFTIPWPEGTVIFARDGPGFVGADGSLSMKWPWWRGVPGKLSIEGRRLDAPGPAPRAEFTDGYGDSGFQPIALIFPTQGCWEVTGKVGSARLTFVTLVVKIPFRELGLKWGPQGMASSKRDMSNLRVSLRDIYSYSNGGELIVESAEGERATISQYPAAAQQKVTVQRYPGICVQGAFVNQQWQDNADVGILEWTADGASYRISQKGLGLRCDDLLSMPNLSNWR